MKNIDTTLIMCARSIIYTYGTAEECASKCNIKVDYIESLLLHDYVESIEVVNAIRTLLGYEV